MAVSSQEFIRDINRSFVLDRIIREGKISRADLAKKLDLTRATVSTIVQELIDRKLIREIGNASTSKGRKPILLEFCGDCGSIISVNLGVSRITILVSDLAGHQCSVEEHDIPTTSDVLLDDYLIALIQNTRTQLPPSEYGLVGISIGIYGVVCDQTILFTPYYNLKYSNLKTILEDTFHVPAIIENDANLSVIGESVYTRNSGNMIFLNIHEGVGMGILMNGKLYKGQNGYAGEFGHTILIPDGRPCPCGNRGCLEQYISESAVLADYAAARQLPSVTLDEFLTAYMQKDPDAIEQIRRFSKYLSIGLNTVLHTFNPDTIIINSSFINYIPDLLPDIRANITNRLRWYLHVIPSALQDISVLMGGVFLVSRSFLGLSDVPID